MREGGGGGRSVMWLLQLLTVAVMVACVVTSSGELDVEEVLDQLEAMNMDDEELDQLLDEDLTALQEKLYQLDNQPAVPDLSPFERMLPKIKLGQPKTVGDLLMAGKQALNQGQVELTRSLTVQAHRYYKAVRNVSSVMVTGAPLVTLTLDDDTTPPDWILQVTGLHLHTHLSSTYMLLGSLRSREQRVVVWSSHTHTLTTLARFQLTDVSIDKVDKMATYIHDGYLFMVLGSSHSRLLSVVCVQLSSRRVMLPQVITQRGLVGALHLLKAGGNLYLVVGESHYYTPNDGKGRSELYMLVGEFFDKQEEIELEASGVRDITSFASQGNHYIVFGMENSEGSKVYALHTKTHTFTTRLEGSGVTVSLVQHLDEPHVQQVDHFRDQTDLKHFVVVLSRVSSSAVYWWNDHQLVKWQTLDTPQAPGVGGSLALLPLTNYEHLLFASAGSNITVYTYHTTGTHQPSFIVATTCHAIRDMSAVKVGTDYLLVYVCVGPVNSLEARLVHLEDLMEGREEQRSGLSTCLGNLRAELDSRKVEVDILQQVVDTDALMTVDHAQEWSGAIVVPELWVEKSSSLQHTVVITPGGEAMNQSLNEYQALVTRLQAEVTDVQAALGSILYYAGTQTITNPTSVSSLVATQAHFDVVSVDRLHGVPLMSLGQEVLLDGPDQTITGHWQLGQLTTQRLTTRTHHPPGRLNGVLTADLMRRSVANQVVTGRHDYRSISAGRICHRQCEQELSILVNGVDTSTIVTQGADVTFTARKTFRRVVVREGLDVSTINGVSLNQVLGQVVFTDVSGTQVLSGRHAIQRLTVEGNLNVGSVNGINVFDLDKAVVKKHGDYTMAGSIVYKRNLVVQGSTEVPSVNGVPWGEFVVLDAPGSISGSYTFMRASVMGALRSDHINGLDLSEEAVLLDLDQNIQGRIRFLETVRVTGSTGVRMGEGVTLNGIDPSEVAMGGGAGGGGGGTVVVVVEEDMNVTSMQVSGNVVITSINGVDLRELEHRYWRKSVSQEINAAVHIKNAVFLGGVEGSTLNGHALTDYLRADSNQRITGRYTFKNNVEVRGNLVVGQGRRVGGVDVSTLHARVVTLDTQQTVESEVIFSGRVTVVGDVNVEGDLLQVLSRGLRLDETIPHTGHLNFVGGAVMGGLQVTGSDVTVASLNGLDVAAAAADLVLVDQDATINGKGGLRFSGNVNIRDLRVSGLVDGVDVGRMLTRALRTSSRTAQVVSAALTVEGDVHFNHAPTLALVNGEDWLTHLGNVVQVGQQDRIEGRKLFAGGLRVTGNLQAKRINGVQIGSLASRILRKSSQQVIKAHYTFTSDVAAEELSAPVIDGVTLDEVVLLDEGGEVGGSVSFTQDVTFLAGLTADTNILDSCDFGKLQMGPTLGGGGEAVVDMPMVEIDTLVVEGQTFLSPTAAITSHNFNLVQFLNSLVLKSKDQVITADVKFLNDVRVGEMRAAVVDGVDVETLFRQAVLRGDDVVIDCDLHLTEGLQVGRLEVKSGVDGVDGAGVLLNGVDLSELQRRAVRCDGRTYVLEGRKVFTAGLATHRLKTVTVAGVAVRDMVTVGAASTRLPPHLVFRAPITVLGDLWVSGLVDGVDLGRLFAERVRLDVHQTLSATYHFEALRIEGDLTTSTINNVTISDLVLRSGVARQVISGAKVLSGGLQVNGVLQVGSLNGVDVIRLNKTVVRVNQGSAVIHVDTRFEGEVRCLAGTEVRQTVSGLDLSELARRVSQIQQRLVQEKQRFGTILSQFGSLNEDNHVKARELYAELASLERVFLPQDTSKFGHLWVGFIPDVADGQILKITKCPVLLCGCDIECHYFKVANDTRLTPVHNLVTRVAVTTHLLQGGRYLLLLHSQCVGGRDLEVKVSLQHHTAASVLLQGILIDSAVFMADGVDYLVAALYKKEDQKNVYDYQAQDHNNNDVVVSEVVVVRVDAAANSLYVVTRWVTETLVVALDVARAGQSWFLLLANGLGDTSVDRYVTPSEILRWDANTRRFHHKEDHMGSYLSGGSFVQVMGETFIVLTQYKSKPPKSSRFASSCASKVLVFRYNKATDEFVEFQSIAAYGVVSQTTLQVDRSLYLILASPSDHCIYVCLYKHSEGFVIIHKVFLDAPLSVVVVAAGEDTYLLVSTEAGVERYKVFVKGVDPDTLYLY